VLYFPPIHPIGRAFRKGRNNTLTPGEHDPGSPYAIGSAEGGHTDIHPELGTGVVFIAGGKILDSVKPAQPAIASGPYRAPQRRRATIGRNRPTRLQIRRASTSRISRRID